MKRRSLLLAGCALLLSACASIDGTYLPSCDAYAGSEIRLADGRFYWSKFTDQVRVDEQGNEVDPFPGFPLEGAYEVSGATVTLIPAGGGAPHILHLHKDGKVLYLMTAEEKATLDAGGERAKCALQRQNPGT